MKNKISIAAIVLCSGVSFSNSAYAGFIDHTIYTTDTTSGLDWLDVNQSTNLSKNYVSSQLGAGGSYEGWRYATGGELLALINNYTGLNNNTYGETYFLPYQSLLPLIQLLGITSSENSAFSYEGRDGQYYTYQSIRNIIDGIIADETTTTFIDRLGGASQYTTTYLANLSDMLYSNSAPATKSYEYDIYIVGRGQFALNASSTTTGSFLVRTAEINSVPEPSIFSLLLAGLLGLALRQRKQLGRGSTN